MRKRVIEICCIFLGGGGGVSESSSDVREERNTLKPDDKEQCAHKLYYFEGEGDLTLPTSPMVLYKTFILSLLQSLDNKKYNTQITDFEKESVRKIIPDCPPTPPILNPRFLAL